MSVSPAAPASVTMLERFRLMARMRAFEAACHQGYETGEIHGELHSAVGMEGIAAALAEHLRPADAVVSTHRCHLHGIAKGVGLVPMLAEIFEKETGLCRGRGGHMHLFDPEARFSTTGIVAASLPVALGHAYATWIEGRDDVAVGVVGDGGVNNGAFHEVLNLAGAWRLPLLVLVENNEYAISVPIGDVSATATLAERAVAYRAWGRKVDGTDVDATAAAFAEAFGHVRAGRGPALLEATAHRFGGHYEGDPDHYRTTAYKTAMREHDPLSLARARLLARGDTDDALDAILREADAELEAVLAEVRAAAQPEPSRLLDHLWRPAAPAPPPSPSLDDARPRNFSQAIAEAIGHEMEADDRIVVLGEDVGRLGGVYGATRDLQKRFGERRVRDTPIAEMAFTGMGVGLALAGYRPLVEIMFADFIGVCLEQVYNAMAKIPYMSGGRQTMPMVVKTAAGSEGSAAQHSQCLWGMYGHLPGIRVVVPSNPYEAKGLMAAALRSDDPVVFIEHKLLLVRKGQTFRRGGQVPRERYELPLEGAVVARAGTDLTLATLSASVEDALEAAEALAGEGIDIEVIDLRSIVPLDAGTVAASVDRTRRLLVVDEDYLSFGLSGELVCRVLERLGRSFAVGRLALPDVPLPAARSLEEAALPRPDSIAAETRRLVHDG